MLQRNLVWILFVCVGLLASLARVDASSPSLGSIMPRGGQRGTELALDFHGGRLSDAREILCYSPGFEVKNLEVVNDGHVRVQLHISGDCRLGVHFMRMRTATGITELRTFFVGALAAVGEKEPNSDFSTPQKVAFNSTIVGVVDNEDVDYYSFEVEKGQRISAELEGMRLATSIFDAHIAILDAARFELASCDDSALLKQDPHCQTLAPETGTYYVAVRESSYGGGGNCRYRLHVGTFPRPVACFPAGGTRDQDVKVELIGDVKPLESAVKAAAESGEQLEVFAEDEGGVASSAVFFRPSEFPNTLEVEPNNDPTKGTPAVVPGALNGILGEANDVDFFRFSARKGQVFEVELYGRRIGSPIDAFVRIFIDGGGQIAANDDARGPDSYIRFTAPEDKDYFVAVSDFLRKGSPDYVYRLEMTPVRPVLTLTIPRVDRYSQERQSIAVPKGNRYAALIAIDRRDFGGEIVLSGEELPEGLALSCENVPADLPSIPVLFEATSEAPVAGRLSQLRGRHVDPATGIEGGFRLPIDFLVGSPGQSVYLSHVADRLAVAVTEAAPFQIRIVEPKVPLVRNGSMQLRIVAERREGFEAPIGLEMVFHPPGVSAQRGVSIPQGANEATMDLNAAHNAQVRGWKIVVNGNATVGDGPVWVATPFATLNVAEPRFHVQAQSTSVELGQKTEVFCKVQSVAPFEGKAKVELLGLPHKVSSVIAEVAHGTEEFSFPLQVAADSPAGHHKGIFCRVTIVENGEPMVHATGGTELRLDKPLPPPKPRPQEVAKPVEKPKPPPPPPAPAPKKQLTRLEKVRLEYRRRRDGVGGEQ